MLKEFSFEAGSLETMIERLFKTMNSIDKQWSEKVEPASQKQIHALEEIADLKQHGKSIPYAYLLFLEEMGQNDNGLLEQEWDGYTEVNIDSILRDYLRYIDEFDIDMNEYMLFSTHWSESVLFLKLTEGENPPVYKFDGQLFSGSLRTIYFKWHSGKRKIHSFYIRLNLRLPQRDFVRFYPKSQQKIFNGQCGWN